MADRDLTTLLNDWPFESGEIIVRLIEAADGRPIIQMRVDLGVLQMEVQGRPDGQRIEGYETLLDACLAKLDAFESESGGGEFDASGEGESKGEVGAAEADEEVAAGATAMAGNEDEEGGEDEEEADEEGGFRISEDDARRLREEVIQFYHRYVSLFALEEYSGVIRDTEHNLAIFDFCKAYGSTEFDRSVLEQLRPNTIMMRARAQASVASAANDTKRALGALDQGLEEIREALTALGIDEQFDEASEVQMLRSMRDALVPKLPVSQRSELQDRLKAAIAAENYELAAILRDELRMMK